MKNRIMFLLVTLMLGSQSVFAQREPILERGTYEPEQLKEFALSGTKKADKYRSKLIYLVNKKMREGGETTQFLDNDKNIIMIFDHTVVDEVDLAAGTFKNSAWNVEFQDVIFGGWSTTPYSGFAGITTIFGIRFPSYKYDCANFLDAPLIPIKSLVKKEPEKEVVGKCNSGSNIMIINNVTTNNYNFPQPKPEEKKVIDVKEGKITFGQVVLGVGGLVLGVLALDRLVNKKNHEPDHHQNNNNNNNNNGEPAGAPSYPAGSPEGAPSYGN